MVRDERVVILETRQVHEASLWGDLGLGSSM